jgi:hypothetical protein
MRSGVTKNSSNELVFGLFNTELISRSSSPLEIKTQCDPAKTTPCYKYQVQINFGLCNRDYVNLFINANQGLRMSFVLAGQYVGRKNITPTPPRPVGHYGTKDIFNP